MPTIRRRTLLALACLALASATAAPGLAADTAGAPEMSLGNPKAKVKVVEYASVTCPHCARFNAEVFPAFKAKYVDTGQVFYTFREFPTDPVQLAVAGFLVARCAGPDKYFTVLDALFRGQEKLFSSQDARAYLFDAGKAGGLDEERVKTCVGDKAAQQALAGRVNTAIEVEKIDSTPTFLIGDKKLVGEQTLAQLDAAIQPLLARK